MASFGEWGSIEVHTRYKQLIEPKSRRLCHCGCKTRATHVGMANGVALIEGCNLSVSRWVKHGRYRFSVDHTHP